MLPKAGGLLDQDEETVKRLLAIYDHLEDWREIEVKKSTPQEAQPAAPRG